MLSKAITEHGELLSHLKNKMKTVFADYAFTTSDDENINTHPHFLKVPTTVAVIEGSNVILSCRIENLDERMVFWIRNSDLQILTAGLSTFTADTRFKVNHENSIDATDWSLLITDVKMEDQGLYECQINTEPKMKLNINLMVKGENFSFFLHLLFMRYFHKKSLDDSMEAPSE